MSTPTVSLIDVSSYLPAIRSARITTQRSPEPTSCATT